MILCRDDLDFLLHDWLDVTALTERPAFAEHDRSTFDAVLELAERMATDDFAPRNRAADLAEPHLVDGHVVTVDGVADAVRAFAQAGFVSATVVEQGGSGLPFTVGRAALAWFQAANIGTASYPFLTMAAVNLLLAHGTPEQIGTWVPPMMDGRYSGTMCLSEPQAGSSLADITTRAVPADDGSYRVTGTKMWISGGEHELTDNIVHLVLARLPGGPAGVKGISLIAVPRVLSDGTVNDVALVGLNHKMGYRGTTNTLLAFGEQGGAVGWRVGDEHAGLAAMFHMMNEARVGVGMGAAALGVTGYLHALEYARTRTQGRAVTGRDVTTPMVPIIRHADVRRMLLAQKSYAEAGMALTLYCSRLVDEKDTAPDEQERARAALLLDVLTPIAKSWPSQWCLAANDLAIQVHGGYGYTRGLPGRAVLARQPAQPDPRGHPRRPGDRPARTQGRHGRRRRPGAPTGDHAGDGGPRRRHPLAGGARRGARGVAAADRDDDQDAARHGRRRGHPGQRECLPRGGRARRGRLDVAGAGAGHRRTARGVRRR